MQAQEALDYVVQVAVDEYHELISLLTGRFFHKEFWLDHHRDEDVIQPEKREKEHKSEHKCGSELLKGPWRHQERIIDIFESFTQVICPVI